MRYQVFFVLFLLSACSVTGVNSNMGDYAKKKVQDNIRKRVVKRYSSYQVWELNASLLGHVETDFCQSGYSDSVPSQHWMISDLEVQVQKLGGNGLVFDSCIVHKASANCFSYTKCRGTAYSIPH
ncbi:hypothetical protein [Thalassomonas haliotis]|uniref:hypothetical protein n=1 Tax=Thalassomonas haliotis TaxID=485448 RepID=UPI00236255E3|nr:hypothetical protein [Thalassomonas haliotis]